MLSTILLLLLLKADPLNYQVQIVESFSTTETCNNVIAYVKAEESKPGYNGPIVADKLACFTMYFTPLEPKPEDAPAAIKCEPKKVLGKDVNCKDA